MEAAGKIVEKLKFVLEEINSDFDQEHIPEYNKPYDYGDCEVFFWECGGVLLWKRWCVEFSEDDGYWFIPKTNPDYMAHSWLKDKDKCYRAINKWLKNNGTPYYYVGTDIICGYEI